MVAVRSHNCFSQYAHFQCQASNIDSLKDKIPQYLIDECERLFLIDGKNRFLTNNKKMIVNKLFSLVQDDWIGLGEAVIRRTIKKFIDGNLINTK